MKSAEFALIAVPRGCIDFAGGFAVGRQAGETYVLPRTTSPGGGLLLLPGKVEPPYLNLNLAGVAA